MIYTEKNIQKWTYRKKRRTHRKRNIYKKKHIEEDIHGGIYTDRNINKQKYIWIGEKKLPLYSSNILDILSTKQVSLCK